MKTFEQLTIDELIDYCIDLRESMHTYKELPEINTILKKKLDLITDEEEKDYYETVIKDIILEIENHVESCNYDLVKDKILEEYVSNFNIIDNNIKQKLEIERLLKIELNTINMRYFDDIKHYLAETNGSRYLKGLQYMANERPFWKFGSTVCFNGAFDQIPINIPNLIDFNFKLDTIGQFQRLDYEQHQEINFPIDIIANSFFNLLWNRNNDKVIEIFKKRTEFTPEVLTCSMMIDSVKSSSKTMSYFKINKARKLPELELKEKNSRWNIISSTIKSFMDNKSSDNLNEVVWFKINSLNQSNNFNYSDIYKNKKINSQNITWFKLMNNENLENHSPIAYCRIDIDGSITKEEIAYFDTNNKALCRNNRYLLPEESIEIQPDTLHYFVTDNNSIDENKEIPLLIGYSESNCLSYVK